MPPTKPHPLLNRNFRDKDGNSLVLMDKAFKSHGVQYLQFFNGGTMDIEHHTEDYLDVLKLVPAKKTKKEAAKRKKKKADK